MLQPKIEEIQLRSVLLCSFDKRLKPEEAKENMWETYGDILKICKCRWRHKKFKNAVRKFENKTNSGRPPKIVDNVLKSLDQSNSQKNYYEIIASYWMSMKNCKTSIKKFREEK
jgi:hypothetical protein